MSGETITGTYSSGQLLTTILTNPVVLAPSLTITSTGSTALGSAVVYDWTIQNSGLVQVVSGTSGAAGIALSGGAVTNTTLGRIAGFTSGVTITGAGTVVNEGSITVGQTTGSAYTYTASSKAATILSAGVILGSGAITNASGGVINGGLGGAGINGTGSVINAGTVGGSSFGVMLASGGLVSNAATGTISGHYAVYGASTSALTLVNQGLVDGALGYGVVMDSGGIVTNAAGGTITASSFALFVGSGNLSTVTNAGTIRGSIGIRFLAAGTVANAVGGVIAGANYAIFSGAANPVTVTNAGVLTGTAGAGVVLFDGGLVSNASGGTISGAKYAVYAKGALPATITNQGLMTSPGSVAVAAVNGLVSNASGGTIAGAVNGVGGLAGGYLTVANAGVITGTSSDGVFLTDGGVVSNASGGTIGGGKYAIVANGAVASSVVNAGVLTGTAVAGVLLNAGGSLSNASTGTITGGYAGIGGFGAYSTTITNSGGTISGYQFGMRIDTTDALVINSGSISNAVKFAAAAVGLNGGGSVTNQAGGHITSQWIAVKIGVTGAATGGTFVNAGSVFASDGTNGAAVWIHGPGLVSNAASGTINGGPFGVVAYYATTLINSGSIGGTQFAFDPVNAGFVQRVIVNPGAKFTGLVSGGNSIGSTVVSTLELASGASAGTLSGIGTQFIQFGNVKVDSGAAWTLTGANTVVSGATLTANGTLINTGSLGGGVVLDGGVVSNASGATIAGSFVAVYGPSGSGGGTILNAGVLSGPLTGHNAGIGLFAGGVVSNAATGTIIGAEGAYITGSLTTGNTGTLVNFGLIIGNEHQGAEVDDGGSITNAAGGTISGYYNGIAVAFTNTTSQSGTVFNAGVVTGTTGAGVEMLSPGTNVLTNAAGGVITGGLAGVSIAGGGVVTNAGSIGATGTGTLAVIFGSGAANRLIVAPGAAFTGTVEGGNTLGATAVSTLELASGASNGTLSGIGAQFVDFARVTVDAGASWTLTGANTIATGASLTDSGTLTNTGTITGGVLLGGGTVTNASGALISGVPAAIFGASGSGAGTVVNAGGLFGGTNPTYSAGIALFTNGFVSNAATGTISGGGVGIYIGGTATVLNAGFVTGTGTVSSGVELYGGGFVSNAATGTISGSNNGVNLDNAGTVTNAGLIQATGTSGNGVYLRSGGTVTNTGTITGTQQAAFFGGSGASGGTLINAGTISGTLGAVGFASGKANRVVFNPGAVFTGVVSGGNTIGSTIVSTLELTSAASNGKISGIGSQFVNFSRITLDSSAAWAFSGANTILSGATLTNSGTVFANGTLTDKGLIDSTGGTVIVGSTAGTNGALTVSSGGTFNVGTVGTVVALFIGNGAASGTLAAATGTVLVSGVGATMNAYGPVRIGRNGATGLLAIAQGATAQAITSNESAQAAIGIGLSGPGTLVVTGSNSRFTAVGQIVVGRAGAGSLLVTNAGSLVFSPDSSSNAASLEIGVGDGTNAAQTGGSGTATVSAGGVISGSTTTSQIKIGGQGDSGTLIVNAGTVTTGTIKLGSTSTIAGTVFTGTGILNIGSAGLVQALGTSSASVVIGQNQGGSGTVSVVGGTLVSAGQILVSNQTATTGLLSIGSTGIVTAAGLTAGQTAGGVGTVLVNGGTLTETGFLGIGGLGSGAMTISAGGTVIATQGTGPAADIGASAGGLGTVVVTGTQSLWQVNGQLIIGDAGSGSLDVNSNAVVNAGTNLINIGNQNGAAGIVSVSGGGTLAGGILSIASVGTGGATGLLTLGSGGTVAVTSATVGKGGTIAMAGGLLDPAAVTVSSGGTITGFGTLDASLNMTGTVIANGGLLDVTGSVTGNGTIGIAAGATLELDGFVGANIAAAFAANSGVLQLGTIGFSGTIDGFQQGDSLILAGISDTTSVNLLSGNTLDIARSAGPDIFLKLDPTQSFAGDVFHLTTTGGATVLTEDTTPCYLAGTLIRTDRGDIPVEELSIGDRVITLDGAAEPIKWIGKRAFSSAFAAGNRDVIPILIKRGALGDGLPVRDLFVSPLHAMYLEGVLVRAEHLVNGASIARCPHIDPIRYFHIELERHDIIFAEGAAAETFIDCDSRGMFHNAAEFSRLYPDSHMALLEFRAPLVDSGPVLGNIREAIDRRAGLQLNPNKPGALHGNLDGLDGSTITGWAFDPDHPDVPVTVEVLNGDGLIARVTANRFRADLEQAGIGDGRFGFELRLARPLSAETRHELRVRRLSDGRELPGSPLVVEPHDRRTLVRHTRQTIEAAAEAIADPAALDGLLETLLSGVATIRRLRASRPTEAGDPRLLAWAKGKRQQAKRALIITEHLPRRDTALLSHVAALRGLGWAIELVAAAELSRGDDAAQALLAWGVLCHRAPLVASVEEVLRRERGGFDLVYLHQQAAALAYGAMARGTQPRARIVFAAPDTKAVTARTIAALRLVDAAIVHSDQQAADLRRAVPSAVVRVVPWSVAPAVGGIPPRLRQGIAAVCEDADAVHWLTREVMPRVWARDPELSCALLGDRRRPFPADPRLRWADPADGVSRRVRLLVVPSGSATTAVVDGFAAGLPVVMTPAAAAGLALDRVLRLAVTGDAAEMAELICDLYHQPGVRRRQAQAGLAFIRNRYNEALVSAAMRAVVEPGNSPDAPVTPAPARATQSGRSNGIRACI